MKDNDSAIYRDMEEFFEKEEELATNIMENIEGRKLGQNSIKNNSNLAQQAMSKKQYEMYRAEQFVCKVMEDSYFNERYAVLLNNYYKSGIKMNVPYILDYCIASILIASSVFYGISSRTIGCAICGVMGATWLLTTIKSHSRHKMEDAIDKARRISKKQQLGVEYLESQEDTNEYLGRLSFLQYKKVLKNVNKKFDLKGLIQSREQKILKADAEQKEREKKRAMNNILSKNDKYDIQSDSMKEEELLNK